MIIALATAAERADVCSSLYIIRKEPRLNKAYSECNIFGTQYEKLDYILLNSKS